MSKQTLGFVTFTHLRRILLQQRLKLLSALAARVQAGEQVHVPLERISFVLRRTLLKGGLKGLVSPPTTTRISTMLTSGNLRVIVCSIFQAARPSSALRHIANKVLGGLFIIQWLLENKLQDAHFAVALPSLDMITPPVSSACRSGLCSWAPWT